MCRETMRSGVHAGAIAHAAGDSERTVSILRRGGKVYTQAFSVRGDIVSALDSASHIKPGELNNTATRYDRGRRRSASASEIPTGGANWRDGSKPVTEDCSPIEHRPLGAVGATITERKARHPANYKRITCERPTRKSIRNGNRKTRNR